MAVYTTVDIGSFHADVLRAWTAVSPPLSRTKQADDRRASGYSDVRRTRVAADVNFCPARE